MAGKKKKIKTNALPQNITNPAVIAAIENMQKNANPVTQNALNEALKSARLLSPVQVDIDGTKFDAKVVKPKTANRKGTQYGVATGRRNITVTFEGKTIYQKQLFLSSQETKIIDLP